MTEFETKLLETLKGIQRELVILNTPEKISWDETQKDRQIRLFLLEDLLEIYRNDLGNQSPTIREEAMENFKNTLKEINQIKGVRSL